MEPQQLPQLKLVFLDSSFEFIAVGVVFLRGSCTGDCNGGDGGGEGVKGEGEEQWHRVDTIYPHSPIVNNDKK